MTDEEAIVDDIAKSLDCALVGKQTDHILRAFGFIISSMSIDCPCTTIDNSLGIVREAAEAHFALTAKQALR